MSNLEPKPIVILSKLNPNLNFKLSEKSFSKPSLYTKASSGTTHSILLFCWIIPALYPDVSLTIGKSGKSNWDTIIKFLSWIYLEPNETIFGI